MRKANGVLFLIILLSSLILPVQALDVARVDPVELARVDPIVQEVTDKIVDEGTHFTVLGGVNTQYYAGSTGYDRILTPENETMVASQRWTVEYLSGKHWKSIGVPYEVVSDGETVTRRYRDYLGTQIEVIYRPGFEGTKADVVIDSGEDRVYRIIWEFDGINNDLVSYGENFVNFTGLDDWITVDWSDAFNQYGNITSYEVSSSSNGKKLDIIFNVGLVKKGDRLILDPIIIDSYGVANFGALDTLTSTHPSASGAKSAWYQSFEAPVTANLSSVQFYIRKTLSPTGNAVAVLYAHTGTFGTSSAPTGAALATSDEVDVPSLPKHEGIGKYLVVFIFVNGLSESHVVESNGYFEALDKGEKALKRRVNVLEVEITPQ